MSDVQSTSKPHTRSHPEQMTAHLCMQPWHIATRHQEQGHLASPSLFSETCRKEASRGETHHLIRRAGLWDTHLVPWGKGGGKAQHAVQREGYRRTQGENDLGSYPLSLSSILNPYQF